MKTQTAIKTASRFFIMLSISLLLACAVNPVTGKREFMILTEQDEIQMGAETDQEIAKTYGIYEAPQLTAYINRIGQDLKPHTHRPNMEYKFKVLDSPIVNAFAVPGGYIYMTRGILAYFNNEAELAGVLSHELGHVNARHTARSYSRASLAMLGIGIGSVISEKFAKVAGVFEFGASLLFLKFSRDDERQADDLGVEYSSKAKYDAHQMAAFFETLERMHPQSGLSVLPDWFSTHPNPTDRIEAINTKTNEFQQTLNLQTAFIRQDEYLRQMDGLVFGEDPRQGYVDGNVFYHPALRFFFPVPAGWQVVNTPAQVQMVSAEEDAVIYFTLAEGDSPEQAALKFLEGIKADVKNEESLRLNDFVIHKLIADLTSGDENEEQNEAEKLSLMSYFIQKDDLIYAFHGLSYQNKFSKYTPIFQQTMGNFKRLMDPSKINVEPKRIKLQSVARQNALRNVLSEFGVPSDKLEETALLNGLHLDDTVERDRILKIVR
ncbi:MAG: M48 family metalloprotease [bacterium]